MRVRQCTQLFVSRSSGCPLVRTSRQSRGAATVSGLAQNEVPGPELSNSTRRAEPATAPPMKECPSDAAALEEHTHREVPRPTRTSDALMSAWEKLDGLTDTEPQPRRLPRPPRVYQQYVAAQDGLADLEQYHKALGGANSGPTLGQTLRTADSGLESWVPQSETMSKVDLSSASRADVRGPEAPPMTSEERKAQLNRAGVDPYDTYHGERTPPALKKGVETAGRLAAAAGDDAPAQVSPEMKAFLKHVKFQAGIAGPLAPFLRHQVEQGTYAMPNVNLELSSDPSISNLRRVLSDFDWGDRRHANHVALTYPQGANIVALITCGVFAVLYWWQKKRNWIAWYDEFVGLDLRRCPDLEKPLLLLITAAFVRLAVFHPACVVTVVGIRLTRIWRGRPLGPP